MLSSICYIEVDVTNQTFTLQQAFLHPNYTNGELLCRIMMPTKHDLYHELTDKLHSQIDIIQTSLMPTLAGLVPLRLRLVDAWAMSSLLTLCVKSMLALRVCCKSRPLWPVMMDDSAPTHERRKLVN